jgi:hypothetical protein
MQSSFQKSFIVSMEPCKAQKHQNNEGDNVDPPMPVSNTSRRQENSERQNTHSGDKPKDRFGYQ